MELKLYNTLSRKKELFKPIEPGKAKIYTCGVTVYDRSHLGHARGAINFDVMRNVFKALDYDVTYVKNYTDIDDKMIKRANERGISVKQLANEQIEIHDQDMASLKINPPDIAPKATDVIDEIIKMCETLIEKKYAYESAGDVYFRVRRFPEYGKLSWKNIDDLISGARVEVNEDKEDALDFALWKASKPGEPSWESPWGSGRPGWHIECSAMVNKHLGDQIDIHAGGSDLIFPHHENEIAQSECANGKVFANYWMHNGMVKINQQKMSKSLGNFATIQDLVKKYHPELIRFFTLSAQYRQSLDYNEEALVKSAEGLDRIYGALEKYQQTYAVQASDSVEINAKQTKTFHKKFMEAMCDDLNTPPAIAILFDLTRNLNSNMSDAVLAKTYYQSILDLGSIMGILNSDPVSWFKTPRIQKTGAVLSDQDIESLIQKRIQARTDKNWAEADKIRDQLDEASILVEDKDGKTTWRRK